MASVLHDLTQLHVQALDGICCVDNAAHFGRVGKERCHPSIQPKEPQTMLSKADRSKAAKFLLTAKAECKPAL